MSNEKTPSQLSSLLSIYAGKVGKNLELVQSIGVTPSKPWVSPLREQIKKTNSNWDQFSTLLRSLYELKKKESFSQDDLKQSLIIDLTLSFILCNHPYDDTQTREKFNALLSECATICPDPFLDELRNWHTQTINDLPLLSDYLAKQTNYRNYIVTAFEIAVFSVRCHPERSEGSPWNSGRFFAANNAAQNDNKYRNLKCGHYIPVGLQDAKLGAEVTRDLNFIDLKNPKEYPGYFEVFSGQ